MTEVDRAAYDRLREENERLKRGEKALQDAIVGIGRQWADESEAAEQQVAALKAENMTLREERAQAEEQEQGLAADVLALRAKVERLRRCIAFLASAVKSGESWTEDCQREVDAALAPAAERERERGHVHTYACAGTDCEAVVGPAPAQPEPPGGSALLCRATGHDVEAEVAALKEERNSWIDAATARLERAMAAELQVKEMREALLDADHEWAQWFEKWTAALDIMARRAAEVEAVRAMWPHIEGMAGKLPAVCLRCRVEEAISRAALASPAWRTAVSALRPSFLREPPEEVGGEKCAEDTVEGKHHAAGYSCRTEAGHPFVATSIASDRVWNDACAKCGLPRSAHPEGGGKEPRRKAWCFCGHLSEAHEDNGSGPCWYGVTNPPLCECGSFVNCNQEGPAPLPEEKKR